MHTPSLLFIARRCHEEVAGRIVPPQLLVVDETSEANSIAETSALRKAFEGLAIGHPVGTGDVVLTHDRETQLWELRRQAGMQASRTSILLRGSSRSTKRSSTLSMPYSDLLVLEQHIVTLKFTK